MKNKERLITILLNLLALAMLVSVITSRYFYVQIYDETNQANMIVYAMCIITISALFEKKKKVTEEGR